VLWIRAAVCVVCGCDIQSCFVMVCVVLGADGVEFPLGACEVGIGTCALCCVVLLFCVVLYWVQCVWGVCTMRVSVFR